MGHKCTGIDPRFRRGADSIIICMTGNAPQGMTIVDAHVHIHDCFDISDLLDNARGNFSREAKRLGCETNLPASSR